LPLGYSWQGQEKSRIKNLLVIFMAAEISSYCVSLARALVFYLRCASATAVYGGKALSHRQKSYRGVRVYNTGND